MTQATITFDPYDADVLDDPYPHYAQLRDHAPVHSVRHPAS